MPGTTMVPEVAQPSISQALPAHQPPPSNASGSDAGTSVSEPPNSSRLTFDDIAKQFHVPIADAAAALGVCSSVLKRICRENGITRWPYRKYLAGKTVEDIKREAAREKSKGLAELSKSSSASSMPVLRETSDITQEVPKPVRPILGPAQVKSHSHNGSRLFQPIPDFVDEFSYGFPSGGLSLVSRHWWSTPDLEASSDDDDESFDQSDGSYASSSLCSLRRKAIQDGEKFLSVGFSSGCKPRQQERSLIKIFRSSLPFDW